MNTVLTASILIISLVIEGIRSNIRVTTNKGKIQGYSQIVEGRLLNLFLGIPFAKPPLGDLRFQKPHPTETWTVVKQTKSFGPACLQGEPLVGFTPGWTSEDCLTLNVFAPGKIERTNKKPVIVWVYGGGYTNGGSSLYFFHEFAVRGDVIVVSINYRLGVFGFLSTGDVNAPGNLGLWDQIEALKWVRGNIVNFGGDPARVTIFGESAGASSVTQLALTTTARGLFHRFISMSGTALCDWAWYSNTSEVANEIGDIVGCKEDESDSESLIDCLRNADARVLRDAGVQLEMSKHSRIFGPIVDGDMFTEPVSETLLDPASNATAHFRSLDYMGGFLSGDGGMYLLLLTYDVTKGIPPSVLCDTLLPEMARYVSSQHQSQITVQLQVVYCNQTATKEEAARSYIDMLTDAHLAAPTVDLLTAHAAQPSPDSGSTYLYYFTKVPSFGHLISAPSWFKGANHADDLYFLTGPSIARFYDAVFKEEEKEFSYTMMTYWSNFAKTGDPNSPISETTQWTPYTDAGRDYLELGDVITAKRHVNPTRMHLWREKIPRIADY